MQPLLEVQHLRKQYATQLAVDDISFQLQQGSIFGLLGPNGAGKTTLLRMITGIFYPDEGKVLLDGKPFDPINDVSKMGYMPEERGLYKKMKIGEQALYLAQLKGLSKQEALSRVKDWFVRLEMQSWWNKKVEDLSKGMSQKLQFVTTVLHEPRLIILDEPFSGLDPVNANLIKDEIFNLSRKGCSIIFSTHRMEQVEEICDHIILVNQGKKILDGTVHQIKQNFKQHEFVLQLADPKIIESAAAFSIVKSTETQYVVKINEGFQPNDVLQHFIQKGASINGFQEVLPSLNDIFIQLVEASHPTRQFVAAL